MISEEQGDKLMGGAGQRVLQKEWGDKLLKYLPIAIILLLTLGNYLQSRDIDHLASTLRAHLQVDPASFKEQVKSAISNFQLRLRVMERQVQFYKKSVQLDLLNQMSFLNRTLANTTKMIEQIDESVATLEATQLYLQFLDRKQETEKIIDSNITLESFGQEFDKYTRQYKLTLNNIENPYYDLQNRHNHTEEMRYLVRMEYENYQGKYNIDKYNYEISMCVVVPTRNNVEDHRYIYNLQSILNQNYSNYRVVIVDDHSDDKTGVLIERFLRRRGVSEERAVVVKREKREGSLANFYHAMHNYCRNYTVTLEVDGDDQLIGKYVFKLFNAVYQSKNPGFAYSNHVYYAEDEEYISKGYSEAYSKLSIEKQNYRKIIQKFGHLRSFRTELFFKIKEQDLRDAHGQFFLAAGDEAFIFPMLEMSCRNIEYIDQATYLYNGGTGSNIRRAFKKQQEENAIFIRLQKKYACLPLYQNPLLSLR